MLRIVLLPAAVPPASHVCPSVRQASGSVTEIRHPFSERTKRRQHIVCAAFFLLVPLLTGFPSGCFSFQGNPVPLDPDLFLRGVAPVLQLVAAAENHLFSEGRLSSSQTARIRSKPRSRAMASPCRRMSVARPHQCRAVIADEEILLDIALRQVFPGFPVLHFSEPDVKVPAAPYADAALAPLPEGPVEGRDIGPLGGGRKLLSNHQIHHSGVRSPRVTIRPVL